MKSIALLPFVSGILIKDDFQKILPQATAYTTSTSSIPDLKKKSSPFRSYCSPSFLLPPSPTQLLLSRSNDITEDASEEEVSLELQRTKERFEKMMRQQQQNSAGNTGTPLSQEEETLYQQFIVEPANKLKTELQELNLKATGRKPDLARRLASYYAQEKQNEKRNNNGDKDESEDLLEPNGLSSTTGEASDAVTHFASISPLSDTASKALTAASISTPTPIQKTAIPFLHEKDENCILHGATGSGKTLAYLLPITERIQERLHLISQNPNDHPPICLVLTPTRELASQVAGITKALLNDCPSINVRLVLEATNIAPSSFSKRALNREDIERGEQHNYGGRTTDKGSKTNNAHYKTDMNQPQIIIGSAKSIYKSLFGDDELPGSPTPKPLAKEFVTNVRWLVLDEVDRLLNVGKTRQERKKTSKKHEKPAAVLTSCITRETFGKAQVVSCSATVGRPLRRELARVLGLPSKESPTVIRGEVKDGKEVGANDDSNNGGNQVKRLVTIPSTIEHYVLPCDGISSGSLLTTASFLIKKIVKPGGGNEDKKILLVLTRKCGMNVKDTIGALRHFNAHKNPQSLLDMLQGKSSEGDELGYGGTDRLIEIHREVSRSNGIGYSSQQSPSSSSSASNEGGYLLVTGEDSVRGLHLDQLDLVVVVGRPAGPDEYTHIAGRTGRAGSSGGKVVNVVGYEQAAALSSWESMLNVQFYPIDMEEVDGLY